MNMGNAKGWRRELLCAGGAILAMMLGARAAPAGDAIHGKEMAQRWCASCHVVSDTQKKGTTGAPPFSEIASREGFDAGKVALFLLAPHPIMPDMNLSRIEATDLAAYIATLKK